MLSGSNRTVLIAGGGLLVLLGGIFFFSRSSFPESDDPEIAKVERAERKKDAKSLIEYLKSPREDITIRAMTGLAHVSKKDALPELDNLMKDARVAIRSTAAGQYAATADRGQVGPLIERLQAEKDPVAKAALAAALGQNRGWDGAAALVPLLDDANSQVRLAAANSLLSITGLKPGITEKSTSAERKRTIATLTAKLPNMKAYYDRYWQEKSAKEKP